MAAHPEVLAYLRQAAIARHIDPDIAVRAFGHEALNVFDPNQPDRGGDHGSSFGPAQLHYGGLSKVEPNPGLGDAFTKATGLDARDPSTWPQQIDFALDHVTKNGWGAWMGAKAEGITGMMGVNGRGGGQYSLTPLRHVGGAGSGPKSFNTPAAGYTGADSAGAMVAGGDGSYPSPPPPIGDEKKPKSWNESLGEGLGEFGDLFKPNQRPFTGFNMPPAEWAGGGPPMPSVSRSQLMPTSVGGAGIGGGGGGDMRQLLAMLMGGGGLG